MRVARPPMIVAAAAKVMNQSKFTMNIRRFVDLSVPLVNAENGVAADPPGMIPQIDYLNHQAGAQQMAMMFPGLK